MRSAIARRSTASAWLPMEKTLETGRTIGELPTRPTVDAIHQAMAASKTSRQD